MGSYPNHCLQRVLLNPFSGNQHQQHCKKNSQSLQHFILTPMLVNSTPLFLVKDLKKLTAGKKFKCSLHNSPSSEAPI